MRKIHLIFLLILLVGCKNKRRVELEIITKKINSLKYDSNYYNEIVNTDFYLKKSKTIIVYKLTNYNDKAYYFNLDYYGNIYNKINGLSINKATILFSDNQETKAKINYAFICKNYEIVDKNETRKNMILEYLNYKVDGQQKFKLVYDNFVIHPNGTIYFEWFLNLPYGNSVQNANIIFDNKKEYNAEIFMFSDSTNYKKNLSRTDLQTINKNGYEVYHGIIKSKNKVPVRFIE